MDAIGCKYICYISITNNKYIFIVSVTLDDVHHKASNPYIDKV
jgi:hypothetical protein